MKRLLVCMLVGLILGLGQTVNAADDLSVQLLSGEEIRLDGAREKPLYLKFWATWCGECRAEMPHLEEIYRSSGDEIDVVAINFGFNDTPELVRAFQEEFQLSVPIALDSLGNVARSLDVFAVPYSVIIDQDGEIAHRGFGNRGVDEKLAELAEELQ